MPTLTSYTVRARNLAVDSDNKIHDNEVAAKFGFSGGLVPGVELFAYAAHPLAEMWGPELLNGGRLQLRFRRPVYEGDEVTVTATGDGNAPEVQLTVGTDAEPRAVGTAERQAPDRDLRHLYDETPLPAQRWSTDGRLPSGAMGSVTQEVDRERHNEYLAGIGEQGELFRGAGLVHPGALLRMVNDVLMQNVELGPWIHTASDARFLVAARLPATLACHGFVTGCFERNGNAYVRYDALVTADGTAAAEVDHTAIYRLADAG